jgi:rhodanese-related sulfurtransferase
MPGPVSAAEAKALVHDRSREIALLDVREHGQYGEGHPFLAVPCPFSRLEAMMTRLVPRTSVPLLLLDEDDGVAERAAATLAEMGYRDIRWVEGGAPAWVAAGFTLFKGVNLPSKTLGELLEHEWQVPRITIEDFARWRDEDRGFRLFDGRPASEHRKMRVPGAVSLPNGELPHRFGAAVEDGQTPIVIHCAGRTRSIIGAAGLALAGVPNPVYALENGTQGWALSGRVLEHGAVPAPLPALGVADRSTSEIRARALMKARQIPEIDLEEFHRLAADASRTLYVMDVRSSEVFAHGSLPGAVHAPAVQLAQATDQWIGVRRARVALLDDTGLRAAITGVFLRMLGYELFVLTGVEELIGGNFLRASEPAAPLRSPLEPIEPSEAATRAAQGGATLLDLRTSTEFRAGHLRGARWAIRPRLPSMKPDPIQPVFLAGPRMATEPAARDLAVLGAKNIWQVAGNLEDWRKSGLDIETTPDRPSDAEAIDFLFFVHDRHDGNMEAARRYLAWETGLVAQLDQAERGEYRIGPSPFAGG